jgi:hypothetical protein
MNSIDPVIPPSIPLRQKESDRTRAVKFALVLGTVLGGAGAWMALRAGSPRVGGALLVLSTSLLILAVVRPRAALAVRSTWLRFGGLLGRINTLILLSALYFVVVTPLGLLARVLGRRSFKPPRDGSYFVTRETKEDPKRFEHPY